MKRLQAFRFALRPTSDQERLFRQCAGACRFVYNRALALEIDRHASGEKRLGYVGTANLLPLWKREPETVWLAALPSQILQQALKDLDRAYRNFFDKRSGFPIFRKKGANDAFRFPQGVTLDEANSRLFLPKIGWVRYRKSRTILGTIKNVTVRISGEKWFVSIQTEREIDTPVHPSPGIVGIDLGVARFATLSDGTVVESPRVLPRHAARLKRLQRSLSRKKKGSKNRAKARKKLARLHRKISDSRADVLHKVSTTICQNHAVVIVEDLNVRGMSASASGTREAPGRRVRQKAGLNRSILDQGWSAFLRMLDYKTAWRSGMVLRVDPRHTSQTCAACGHVSPENRSQAVFRCVSCGH
ncbi:MAG: RNA-guided endonuclease InsQ/TnpB family protein, partial [Leptospirillum sp.]